MNTTTHVISDIQIKLLTIDLNWYATDSLHLFNLGNWEQSILDTQ